MTGPYHCGVLAFDLEQAIDRLGRVYGLRFRAPELRHLRPAPGHENALPAGEPVRFAFSVGETFPYVELIEAQEHGLFGRQHGEGLHHVGIWADLDRVPAVHAAAGFETVGAFIDEDGGDRVRFASDGRIRVECADRRLRPDYERWLRDGTEGGR